MFLARSPSHFARSSTFVGRSRVRKTGLSSFSTSLSRSLLQVKSPQRIVSAHSSILGGLQRPQTFLFVVKRDWNGLGTTLSFATKASPSPIKGNKGIQAKQGKDKAVGSKLVAKKNASKSGKAAQKKQDKAKEVKARAQTKQADVERLKAKKQDAQEKVRMQAEQEKLKAKKQAEQGRLKVGKQSEQEKLQAKKQAELEKRQAEQEKLKAKRQAELEKRQAEQEKEQAEQEKIKAKKQLELQKLKDKKQSEIEKLKAKKQSEIEKLKAKKKAELAKKQAEQEKLKAKKQTELEKLKSKRETERKKLLAEKEKMKNQSLLQKKKEQNEKKKKKPKRVLSPYIQFIVAEMPNIMKDPNVDKADRMKFAVQKWNSLTAEEKQPYVDLAVKDRERREREVKEYWEANPKKPPTAFILFSNRERQQVVKENPGKRVTEIAVLLGQKWKELAEEQRKTYTEEADKLKRERQTKA